MKSVLYRSSTRGHKYHGWLDTYHTFSFADYYDPERMHFGALRVLNDDIVEGGEGFGTHPHDNMEIISIPLFGDLEHGDSMGNGQIVHTGEVQVMSAGTGVQHSEYNPNQGKPVNFFQIWIFPNKENVEPRYEQKAFDLLDKKNQLVLIVSPYPADESLWIHQEAWMSIGTFDKDHIVKYKPKKEDNGVWAMVIEGEFTVADEKLYRRDGLGIWDTNEISIVADSDMARILLIDVPMDF
ncbi:MAG: pirin family protein [Tannerella sp.]|jgi:redox-sensitive bicupin YhaK (pirin superfamily)|nr:pirin family protein [Tannerella sp.]